jgi:hypothetical protein
MGRPSKLNPRQCADIERRLSEGEKAGDLAREFAAHTSQITRRVSQVSQKVQNVAHKLADKQWQEVDRRPPSGEPPSAIAKDVGLTPTFIRQRKLSPTDNIKDVANQIVAAERALTELPIASQITAQNLAADAKAYGVSKAAIQKRISGRIETAKTIANQTVAADTALRQLSISDQLAALTLAEESRAMADNMFAAVEA